MPWEMHQGSFQQSQWDLDTCLSDIKHCALDPARGDLYPRPGVWSSMRRAPPCHPECPSLLLASLGARPQSVCVRAWPAQERRGESSENPAISLNVNISARYCCLPFSINKELLLPCISDKIPVHGILHSLPAEWVISEENFPWKDQGQMGQEGPESQRESVPNLGQAVLLFTETNYSFNSCGHPG